MEVKAIAKDTGLPASKLRPLVDMVRGKKVDEALSLLQFTRTPKAKYLAKIVKSAAANAENNYQMEPADLKITKIYVDVATSARRFRARSRGRASPIRKHSSHITVIVAEQEG
ncbi:MAG: 50S ribosomal protein L22 [Chloroflexi bacterium RBG_13_51_18]|nr:MAG: 50S ribosomal protein L22 [Chloroflexi bacterium RBG_13_51_18]